MANTAGDLIVGATTTATGSAVPALYNGDLGTSIQAVVSGTGAVTATVLIEVSNDPDTFGWAVTPLATFTLSGTTSVSDIFESKASHKYYRARITALTGTGAAVTVKMYNKWLV